MAAAKSVRDAVESAHRIVVKIGSSSLTSPEGGVDPARVQRLADAVAQRRASGAEVVLVSSGAIAAGLPALGLTRRPSDLASQQRRFFLCGEPAQLTLQLEFVGAWLPRSSSPYLWSCSRQKLGLPD